MPSAVCTIGYRLVSTLRTRTVCGPLCDDHGLEILALRHLLFDVLDDLGQIRLVLCGNQYAVGCRFWARITSSGLVHSFLGRSW